MLWMALGVAWACPDLDEALAKAETDLIATRTEAVQEGLRDIEFALACGPPATQEQVAKLWLLEGVLATLLDEPGRAEDAFSALSRTHRSTWNDMYGPAVLERYEAAALIPHGTAKIRLRPALGGNVAWIDGREKPDMSLQISGLHVIQVATFDGRVRFGKVIYLSPDQTLVVETGMPPAPVVEVRSRQPTKKPGFLVVSGGLLLTSGLLALAAERQNERLRLASDRPSLNRAFAGQAGFASGGLLALTGAAVFSVKFGVAQGASRSD